MVEVGGVAHEPTSRIYHPSLARQRRFVDAFVHGWVGVDCDDEFFAGGFEAAGEGEFGDEFGGLVAHDVGSEDFASGEASDDFAEAFGVVGGDGLAEGAEGELADLVVGSGLEAPGLEGLFCEADAGDLGVAVGAARDD